MTADVIPEPFDHHRWLSLLEEEHGVLHRCEIPAEYVRHAQREIRAKRWTRIRRDVFVAHNGPLTEEQRQWAALKVAPPDSALSGLTAAAIDGLTGFPTEYTHLTMPCGSRRLNLAAVTEHFSRVLSSSDVHPMRKPRRTRLPRSIIDAATWAENDRRARAILLAGVQQGLVVASQLRETLVSRGPCLRHALIAESIDDAEGGIASVPEWEFNAIVRAYRLPEPTRQQVLQHDDGRFYLDSDWEKFELSAEIDGQGHMDIRQWEADLDRANEIVISNRLLLRFTSFAVRHRSEAVATTLIRALTARGWDGP